MDYEQLAIMVKEIDNLVCAQGVHMHTWFLNTKEEYQDMLNGIGEDLLLMNLPLNEIKYRDYLKERITSTTKEESKEILRLHKELWYTLIHKSEISTRYFTPNEADLFKRLLPISKKEMVIILNEYNFLPEPLIQAYKVNPIIEMGSHRVMSYVVHWKKELINRYYVVEGIQMYLSKSFLLKRFRWDRFNIDDCFFSWERIFYLRIEWNITPNQTKRLILIFKRHFLDRTEVDLIVKILWGNEIGNVVWTKSTEALVYFFVRLFEENYIRSENWRMILTQKLMFYSKQGNHITHRNINASLYRIKQKGYLPTSNRSTKVILPAGIRRIDEILKEYSKFLANTK